MVKDFADDAEVVVQGKRLMEIEMVILKGQTWGWLEFPFQFS